MSKFVPMINCGLDAGEEPMVWQRFPVLFDTEEECEQWISDNEDNFTMSEMGGGVYPYELNDASVRMYENIYNL